VIATPDDGAGSVTPAVCVVRRLLCPLSAAPAPRRAPVVTAAVTAVLLYLDVVVLERLAVPCQASMRSYER
jgi:hypothetical protein